ncbi:O-methyltransferase [Streptomyces gobiensis]|uniref:O-methyltransferase n=1 Tax=Streptomyces gobiensis TaxID=2875706 RepID=UPI001E36F796|nr:O-methyltransferase [Streptomyces gobiensis]UGY92853.1 O-methyltransferase [Streptomyces gobiensis]
MALQPPQAVEHPVHIVNPALDDYVLAHCTPADDILRDLAEETRKALPEHTVMQISHDEGTFLTMLTQLTGAQLAVEVGTFTGYSSICIARGLAKDGQLIACDVSEEWTSIARRYWDRAGVADRIDLRIAPAADTLRALPTEETIDFAFIDADKTGYPVYYEELVSRLRPGGIIALDNVLREGRVIDPACQDDADAAIRAVNDTVTADPRVTSVMLPIRDGVTLARKRVSS